MQDQLKQLVDRLNQAQNILVTVSRDPSVDQLAAAIGLTVALNHLGKHGTAVFSGTIPNTLEFLRPEETLEKNTDSLRDFIIALDKSKADKLRYKVENDVVRIFITPYKTSISEKDLDFSQGDFNVDVVLALGVRDPQDLDSAITAHGRILHDATVGTISTEPVGEMGTINWLDSEASSLSEMMVGLIDLLDKKVLDSQIATALLTGIVSSTERFRNDKTSPKTMSASAELMAAGANQQLIATQLEAVPEPVPTSEDTDDTNDQTPSDSQGNIAAESDSTPAEVIEKKPEPGTLEIHHEDEKAAEDEVESNPEPTVEPEPEKPEEPQIQVDANGQLIHDEQANLPPIGPVRGVSAEGHVTESTLRTDEDGTQHHSENDIESSDRTRMTEEPANGGDLTANTTPEETETDPTSEELTLPEPRNQSAIMDHAAPSFPSTANHTPLDDQAVERADQPQWATPAAPQTQQQQPDQPDSNADHNTTTEQPYTPAPFMPPTFPSATPSGVPLQPYSPAPSVAPAPQPAIEPDETLSEIEAAVGSPHVSALAQQASDQANTVDDARDAVEAALSGSDSSETPQPTEAVGASTVFDDAEQIAPPPAEPPVPTNAGFHESTPGNTPADETLDMPLPQTPFGQSSASPFSIPAAPAGSSPFPFTPPSNNPSAFPGVPPQSLASSTEQGPPPPPVPPPMLPRMQ